MTDWAPVVGALRAFPIQPSANGHWVGVVCGECGDGIAIPYRDRGSVRDAALWLREHRCVCDHVTAWSSRECVLCGQSLL